MPNITPACNLPLREFSRKMFKVQDLSLLILSLEHLIRSFQTRHSLNFKSRRLTGVVQYSNTIASLIMLIYKRKLTKKSRKLLKLLMTCLTLYLLTPWIKHKCRLSINLQNLKTNLRLNELKKEYSQIWKRSQSTIQMRTYGLSLTAMFSTAVKQQILIIQVADSYSQMRQVLMPAKHSKMQSTHLLLKDSLKISKSVFTGQTND